MTPQLVTNYLVARYRGKWDRMDLESLAFASRLILGGVFTSAGTRKLLHRSDFERAVLGYQLLPERIARQVAKALPSLETSSGVLLLVGAFQRQVAAGLLALLVIFSIGIAINLLRGRRIDCGCSGSTARRTIEWGSILRNLFLSLLALQLVLMPSRALALDGLRWSSSSGLAFADVIPVIGSVSVGFVLLQLLSSALRLHKQSGRVTHMWLEP